MGSRFAFTWLTAIACIAHADRAAGGRTSLENVAQDASPATLAAEVATTVMGNLTGRSCTLWGCEEQAVAGQEGQALVGSIQVNGNADDCAQEFVRLVRAKLHGRPFVDGKGTRWELQIPDQATKVGEPDRPETSKAGQISVAPKLRLNVVSTGLGDGIQVSGYLVPLTFSEEEGRWHLQEGTGPNESPIVEIYLDSDRVLPVCEAYARRLRHLDPVQGTATSCGWRAGEAESRARFRAKLRAYEELKSQAYVERSLHRPDSGAATSNGPLSNKDYDCRKVAHDGWFGRTCVDVSCVWIGASHATSPTFDE